MESENAVRQAPLTLYWIWHRQGSSLGLRRVRRELRSQVASIPSGASLEMRKTIGPIHLRPAVERQTRADDAGIDIVMTRLESRVPIPAPYDKVPPQLRRGNLDFVPPLAYYCITTLTSSQTLEVDDTLPELVYINNNKDRSAPDVLKALIPFYDTSDGSVELKYVQPNLWLTLAMVYASSLPVFFRVLKLPLEDRHVPYFQTIEPLPRFTLITTLNLSNCRHLTDNNIGDLRDLHQLAYINLSENGISNKGIYALSLALRILDPESETPKLMGPWKLRALYLRHCPWVDDKVGPMLSKWPLLCLVGMSHNLLKLAMCHSSHSNGDFRSERHRLLFPLHSNVACAPREYNIPYFSHKLLFPSDTPLDHPAMSAFPVSRSFPP